MFVLLPAHSMLATDAVEHASGLEGLDTKCCERDHGWVCISKVTNLGLLE